MIRRRPTLLLLLFLLLLPARSPAEGGLGRMRELVRAAEELRAAGRTAEALSRYQEAHAASPSPRLFWPMAELDEQLGRPREGLEALEQYEAGVRPQFRKPGQQQQDIDALRGRLQAQLVRQAVPGPAPGTVATRAAMQAPRRQGRPLWRVISGAAALGVGVGVAGLGISALVVNGQCVQQPVPPAQRCDDLYATTGIGAGLLSAGLALAVAGTVLWAWP